MSLPENHPVHPYRDLLVYAIASIKSHDQKLSEYYSGELAKLDVKPPSEIAPQSDSDWPRYEVIVQPSPATRSAADFPADFRRVLEASNIPIEVATAIADRLEELERVWALGNKASPLPAAAEGEPTPRVTGLIERLLHGDGIPRCTEWEQLEVLARTLERELTWLSNWCNEERKRAEQAESDLRVASGLEHMAYDQRDKAFEDLTALRHDLERHVAIAGEYLRDAERYRHGVEHGFPMKIRASYTGSTETPWAYQGSAYESCDAAIDAARSDRKEPTNG